MNIDPERERQAEIERLFHGARELEPTEWREFVERNCSDSALREEVLSLLHQGTGPVGPIVKIGRDIPTAGDDLSGTVLNDRYRFIRRLGAGGMGQVYLVEDTELDGLVALKRLSPVLRQDPEYRERLKREARRVFELKGEPRVASLFNVFETENEMFLVMEYVEGGTLQERIRKPLTLSAFFDIAIQCCCGLAAAHKKSIIHRDVKPSNILLTLDGKVKIGDFGLARRMRGIAADPDATRSEPPTAESSMNTWGFVGTPAYAPPEVDADRGSGSTREDVELNESSDVFSLGIVFYELLTRLNPFAGSSFDHTRRRVHTETPQPVDLYNSNVSPKLDRLIGRMVAKDPLDRYQTVTEVLRALERLKAWSVWKPRVLAIAATLLLAIGATSEPVQRWMGLGTEDVTLAVLPFQALDGSPDEQAYWHGVAITVADQIATLVPESVNVIPVSEVVRAGASTPGDAFSQLGATRALSFSLIEDGGVVRVAYELTNAFDGTLVGGGDISVPASDPSALQERMVEEVVSLLGYSSGPVRQPGTVVPEANIAFTRGRGYLESFQVEGSLGRAIEEFESAMEFDPGYAAAHAGLGRAYLRAYGQSHNEEMVALGETACARSVALAPTLVDSQLCAGALSIVRGEHSKALGSYQSALYVDEDNAEALLGLASAHEGVGNNDTAEATYRRAIADERLDWVSYSELGSFLNRRGRQQEALEQFDKALEVMPENGIAHRNRGAVLLAMGRFEESREASLVAQRWRPTDATIVSNLWMASFSLGLWDEAIENLEIAVGLGEDHRVTGNLARAYYMAARLDEARSTYQEAIRQGLAVLDVSEGNPDVHILLARYHAMIGDRSAALSYLQFALERRPDDGHYNVIGATVYSVLGERDRALDLLETAVLGGASMSEIRTSRELDDVRDDPRYGRLMDLRQNQ